MDEIGHHILRPIRHYADFRGRSRRTELVLFYIGLGLLAGIAQIVAGFIDPVADDVAETAVYVAFLIPLLALFVRRFHDQGRTGWWLLLLAPGGAGLAGQYWQAGFSLDETIVYGQPMPDALRIVAIAGLLATFVLLLLPEQEGTNRYGPDPRLEDPDDSAPGTEPNRAQPE